MLERSRVYCEQRARRSPSPRSQQIPGAPPARTAELNRSFVPVLGSLRAALSHVAPCRLLGDALTRGASGGASRPPPCCHVVFSGARLRFGSIPVGLVAAPAQKRSEDRWDHPELGGLRCAGWECRPSIALPAVAAMRAELWEDGPPGGFPRSSGGFPGFPACYGDRRALTSPGCCAQKWCCTQSGFADPAPRDRGQEGRWEEAPPCRNRGGSGAKTTRLTFWEMR